MKKNMALVMASMMAALSLTACGGSGAASTAAADTKTADTTAAGNADTKAAPADKIGRQGAHFYHRRRPGYLLWLRKRHCRSDQRID